VKKQILRYTFHEVVIIHEDSDAENVRNAYRKYLCGDSISSHFAATDKQSGELVDINFAKINTIHTNSYTGD
jgi:hypothetical protein